VEPPADPQPEGQPARSRRFRGRTVANHFHLASITLTTLVIITTVGVLAGWVLKVPNWKSVFPGAESMKANTALAFLLASSALLIYQRVTWTTWRDPALRTLAGLTLLIGFLTLVEHVSGWNLHIDQLLFLDDAGVAGIPGRMAVSTAVALLFLGSALLVADTPGRFTIAQILVTGATFLSLINSAGYLFGADRVAVFDGLAVYTAMAMHTSGCLLLLCVAFFFARPSDGLMAVVSDEGPAGFVVRRLVPPVFVVPVGLAWLSRKGELAGYYSTEFSMTFFIVSAIIALSGVVWAGGALLQGLESRRLSAERLRQASEEQIRLAVTEAPVPMVVHDESQILHMSRGWTETSGYSIEDTPTITAWAAKAQGDTKFEVKAYVAKLTTAVKTLYGGESPILTKSGERRTWDFSTTPLSRVGAEGRTYLTLGVDVTDRNRAEADLRRINEDLEQRIVERTQAVTQANDVLQRQSGQLKEQAALLDLVREGIIVRDLYGTIIYWSVGATEMYGFSREQALGQVSHKLLRAVSAQPLPDIEKHVIASGFWEGEMVHTTRDGAKLAVESRWTLTRTDRGVPQGFLEVNRDITAKKRADASLRDSELRFRAVAESANEGIVSADEGGTIRYWNPGAARMFGWTEEQAVGKPLTIMMPERFHADHAAAITRYLSTRDAHVIGKTVEFAGQRQNGTEFPLELSLSAFHTSKGLFFSAILRDITERKNAERALQAKAEELSRSNQELEQFAYVASHDLQEPLRMVANYTKLLGTRYAAKLDTDAQEFIGFAVDGALRMQALIRDLLQFARVGTRGKEFKSTEAGKVVEDAVTNLSGSIEESKAEVIVDTLPTINCDASQLAQVFQNIIGNALKFRRKDATPVVRVSAARDGAAWVFSIKDNGIGIEPKYFERIFQMFQRLHGRDEYPGTGIGLALCKKIVERHGGRITIASEPGQGTTFAFTIPDAGPQKS
jgi:PAS domain S-box-containing protein